MGRKWNENVRNFHYVFIVRCLRMSIMYMGRAQSVWIAFDCACVCVCVCMDAGVRVMKIEDLCTWKNKRQNDERERKRFTKPISRAFFFALPKSHYTRNRNLNSFLSTNFLLKKKIKRKRILEEINDERNENQRMKKRSDYQSVWIPSVARNIKEKKSQWEFLFPFPIIWKALNGAIWGSIEWIK